MKTISLNNMWQLSRFYWRTEKRTYLRLFLTIIALFLFKRAFIDILLMHSYDGMAPLRTIFNEEWLYWGFILISVSFIFSALHQKQHAIDSLTLPANPGEKFLTRIVIGTIGIIVMAFVARIASNLLVILYWGMMELLAGNQPEWGQLFHYFLIPGYWQTAAFFYGEMSLSLFLDIILWTLPLALWPLSWFTLFGLWFRRIGWFYALISMLAIVMLLSLITEIWLRDWLVPLGRTAQTSLLFIISLLSVVNYVLAYHSYRHAQIVCSKHISI